MQSKNLAYTSFVGVLSSEKDAKELVSACPSSGTRNLLLRQQSVSPDFFRLRTGLAGAVLNKFQIYNIKTVQSAGWKNDGCCDKLNTK